MPDLMLRRGDTHVRPIIVAVGGVPKNLTGATLWFTARRSVVDPEAVLSKSSLDGGIDIVDPGRGRAQLILAPADTANLDGEDLRLVYDIQLEDGYGVRWTVATGRILIERDVTRSP